MSLRLGVDFGTSTTVAALSAPDGRVRPLLFDASPLLSSAVFAGTAPSTGPELLTGTDAERAGIARPAGLEPNPKRRIDDGYVWLGEREIAAVDLIATVLGRVAREARRVAGDPPAEVVLTHPAAWQRTRLGLLAGAAGRQLLGHVRIVPEPVAAAAYFAHALGRRLPPGRCLVVYDLGAGTFDLSVVRPEGTGYDVVASAGLPDFGGLDLDALVVAHARALTADATDAWARLEEPRTLADQHARIRLWSEARAAKEQLSRHSTAELHVPLAEVTLHVTRGEFEEAAQPALARTTSLALEMLRTAGLTKESIGAVFLVGGSSRIPLASTLLHRALQVAPTALDQPELVVAEGSLYADAADAPAPRRAAAVPALAAPAADEAAPSPRTVPALPADEAAPRSGVVAAVLRPVEPPSADVLDLGVPEAPPPRRTSRPLWLAAIAVVLVVGFVAALMANQPNDYDPRSGARLLTKLTGGALPGNDAVRSVAFSPDSTMLVTGGDTRFPQLWDLERRAVLQTFATNYQVAVSAVAFSPDGNTIATVGGPLHFYDVARLERRGGDATQRQVVGVTAVAFSPEDFLAATSDTRGLVYFWDTVQSTQVGETVAAAPGGDVMDVVFSPDGKLLATADGNGVIRFWEVRTRTWIGTVLTGHTGAVLGLAFDPDGETLASAGEDGTVRLWDVAGRTLIGDPLTGHEGTVYEVAFSADGRTVASAGQDDTARLWDVADHEQIGEPLIEHGADVYDVAFSPDGKYLATGSADRTAGLWELQL
ncbi:Hsp70 family protein [Cryptosporangium minutisporangium]|uniref:Hsp70 family protein n=1 Tax=Cryptosporangium minutisporangium TaxID=113569 RepID=UPI0035EDD0A6